MTFLTSFIKKLKGVLYRFITTKIVIFIITNTAVLLIVELSEIIKNALQNLNNSILTPLNSLENWLFSFVHDVYTALENALNSLRTKIENALNSLMPSEIESILTLLNWAAWLDALILSINSSIKSSLQSIISTAVSPIISTAGTISNTLTEIETTINQMQESLNQAVQNLYNSAKDQLETYQETYNSPINAFFDSVQNSFDWYNEGVDYIEAKAVEQKQIIEQHNQSVLTIVNQIVSVSGQVDNLSQISNLLDQIQPISTTQLDIDYNQYKILIVTPTLPAASFAMPEFDIIDSSITAVKTKLIQLQTDINTIDLDLKNLSSNIQTQFSSSFPSLFAANLTSQLKTLLKAAIVQVLVNQKELIKTAVTDFKTSIQTQITSKQTEISNKAVEVVQEVNDKAVEVIQSVPDLLKPSLERYIDKIIEEVEKAREQITDNVEITDFLPDIESIQSIMMTLPTEKYKPKTTPSVNAKKRKRKHEPIWTIQDIYRLLCDNFYRNERLALLFALAPEDIRVETSDITSLLIEMNSGD